MAELTSVVGLPKVAKYKEMVFDGGKCSIKRLLCYNLVLADLSYNSLNRGPVPCSKQLNFERVFIPQWLPLPGWDILRSMLRTV